ncbi:unnamed protein product [Arabis nemorensis]|uniref:Uncharacterized protein n=1 Tax=Arabis nemorensis TaxID=586526 RepID=A0A565CHQ1_9BRAS|nr:unnamed protein product [Arabis nemorensis]
MEVYPIEPLDDIDGVEIEDLLAQLLLHSPVAATIPLFESFWNIEGNAVYCPTSVELATLETHQRRVWGPTTLYPRVDRPSWSRSFD